MGANPGEAKPDGRAVASRRRVEGGAMPVRSKTSPTAVFVGRSTLDVVYACDRIPQADAKIDARAGYVASGGPALNAAITFAGLGGRALLLTEIGEGPLADKVRQDVLSHGVEILDAAAGAGEVLPISSIILTGASRAIINQPLAARAADPPGALVAQATQAGADIVLSDGHLPELALPILRWARGAGVPTVLDGGSWKPWTAELLAWIDIAVVSSRFRPPPAGGVSDTLELLRRSVGVAAVTNGADPIRWSSGEASGEIRPPAVAAVDTLGAGDVFHGAFCHAYASSRGFQASLAAAADKASRSVTQWGARL